MLPAAAVAGSIAGAHAARRREADRRAAQALASLLADPLPLWSWNEDLLQPVWLLFVYIHGVNLVPKLANTRLQLRVRYGNKGCYQEKYSQKVRSSTPAGDEQARAAFESMFVYPWNPTLEPSVMIDVVKLGFIDWTISTGALRIPFGEGNPGAFDHDVLLFGKKGEDGFIGQLQLFVEVRGVPRAELELGLERPGFGAPDLPLGAGPLGRFGVQAPLGLMGSPISGTPVVLGHAMPAGVPPSGPGIVQGSALGSPFGGGGVAAGVAPAGAAPGASGAGVAAVREESFRDDRGQVRHVVVTRRADGTEERLEWTDD